MHARIATLERVDTKKFEPIKVHAPLKVAALVCLHRTQSAGGHVKSWERFAKVATQFQGELDLTVHFLGQSESVEALSPNVRYQTHIPKLGTERIPFLSHVPDHTDLAGHNPSLAKALTRCDLIHTTDAFFSFSNTALWVSRRYGIPIVNSVHTDTPNYTRVYTRQTVERLFGTGLISRFLLNGLKVHLRSENRMRQKLTQHQQKSAAVLVSRSEEFEDIRKLSPVPRMGVLRRGIDKELFNPLQRDRAWLRQRFGVPQDRLVVLYVGRLSEGKNVCVAAEAVAKLVESGLPVHFICAGQGPQMKTIVDRLGANVSCPGTVLGEDLARLYASADIFALPSEIEVYANVVQEALSSGLPTLLAQSGGMRRLITHGVTGIVVPGSTPEAWAQEIKALCLDANKRASLSQAARMHAENTMPDWYDVLNEDLLSVWKKTLSKKVRA